MKNPRRTTGVSILIELNTPFPPCIISNNEITLH